MGIQHEITCDACGHSLDDRHFVYCEKCYNNQTGSANEFELECDRLTDRINNLEARIKCLQEIVAKCTHCGAAYSADQL
jgi:predicted metal-binding protein